MQLVIGGMCTWNVQFEMKTRCHTRQQCHGVRALLYQMFRGIVLLCKTAGLSVMRGFRITPAPYEKAQASDAWLSECGMGSARRINAVCRAAQARRVQTKQHNTGCTFRLKRPWLQISKTLTGNMATGKITRA